MRIPDADLYLYNWPRQEIETDCANIIHNNGILWIWSQED